MSDFLYSAPTASADALTTQLDSLVNDALSAQNAAAINNITARLPFVDLFFQFGSVQNLGSAINPSVIVYLIPIHKDDTNYPDTTEQHAVARLSFDEATGQVYANAVNIPIGPFKYAVALRNKTDVTFTSSGNALAYQTHTGGTP